MADKTEEQPADDDYPHITAEQSMRMTALHLAIDISKGGDSGEKEIVEIAKTFLAFLNGDVTTA